MKSLLLLALAACTDPPCVDGVCSQEDYAVAQPGPCESAHADEFFGNHCTYTYDAAKLTQVACTWDAKDPDEHGTDTATYSYDASGNLASIHSVRASSDDHRDTTWTFDAMHAIRTEVDQPSDAATTTEIDTYDRATFQFMPDSIGDRVWPTAELGLQSIRTITPANGVDSTDRFTWTIDGHTLTRGHVIFHVDDQGRLIDWTADNGGPFLPHVATYSYRGDHLVTSTFSNDSTNGTPRPTAWHYDKGGNLANVTSDATGDTAYDYRCW